MFQRPAVTQRISYVLRKDENRNAHLLGVNALALDTSTRTVPTPQPSSASHRHQHHQHHHSLDQQLDHEASLNDRRSSKHHMPGGILYTGGRDGMIAAWDLHFEGLPPSTFRQSFNHHTDWVNDIVLCHNGESLVSASSDRTVKLVRPHSHNPTTAHVIGTHGDYVKTLAYASGPGWLASGGLDKTVHLWDIKEGRSGQFESLGSIPETSSKASIYALACNPSGTVLATGSPEKIIRVWDPRSGQRITKFAGHTDNIRALLISESGDTILSASSDTTIKLWSLTAQRCITTFTMHSDSVWSLYSDHPQLATFYGGGKDGLVTKTEINRYSPEHHNDYDDEDPGQCVVICKAETGVARLVAHDNARIWTATSSSSVFQWPDIPTRVNRSAEMADSIIPANLLKMNLNESTFMDPIPEQYYPTSTVYSAASLGSIYVHSRDKQSQHSSEDDDGLITPIFEQPENVIQGEHGLIKHTLLNNRRMVVTEDKCGEVALWDLIQCVQLETYTGRKLEDVVNELNTIESVPTWCTIDTRIGALTVHLDEGRCFDAEVYVDEIEETPDPERPEDQRIIIGKWVLKNLFERYVPVHIDAYEKEAYRQEHQDDLPQAAVPMTVVTNERNEVVDGAAVVQDRNDTGARATSDHGSRPTVNTSPEGLRGPAASNGENSATPQSESSSKLTSASTIPTEPNSAATQPPSNVPTCSPRQGPVSTAATPTLTRPSNLFTGSSLSATASPTVPSTPLSPASTSSNGFMGRLKHSVKKLARTPSAEHRFENGKPSGSKKNLPSAPANISVPSGSALSSVQKSLNSPSLLPPDSATLSSFQGTATSAATGTATVGTETATNSTASSLRTTFVDGAGSANGASTGIGGGLGLGLTSNGRLDHDDQHSTSDATSSHSSIDSAPSPSSAPSPVPQLPSSTISVRPPHPPFAPPTHLDCPTVAIPAHIPVIISEQSREASSSVDLYRGSVGALDKDYIPLVQVIPTWLLEVLLKNMVPVKEAAKVSFVLRPHHDQEAATTSEDGPGRLGELPGGNPRLTAPRMKMDGSATVPPPALPSSSSAAAAVKTREQEEEEQEEAYLRQESLLRPEHWMEILCHDQVLPPTMTLATIRSHYWKTGSDVVLTYRYKYGVAPPVAASSLSSS
ncbi:hypothetical protein KVV02_008737 [Mortierella alpina]|uniref:Uncharacterized protein n=1 Tax=Mortierella alpina TaxID=64518 RepID=A0A9P8IF01_MORAP|nr:hypothetical protein KVV02_008737 [Mortierella alpina]